jgi:SAM-dependent methyltransferase
MAPGDDSIGAYLLSSRSFEEYRAMFALSEGDLRRRILDCPGGGSSFTAGACAAGADAVAVDPVYVRPPSEVAAEVVVEVDRGTAWTEANVGRFLWDWHGSPEGHRRLRAGSSERFAADLLAHPERYHAGALPDLPYDDGSFDLVLSSHLLFTYTDRLDRAFHLAALAELARVSRHEVRVFPLVDQVGRSEAPLVEWLLAELAGAGTPAEIRRVEYEFQRGAGAMLVLDARS